MGFVGVGLIIVVKVFVREEFFIGQGFIVVLRILFSYRMDVGFIVKNTLIKDSTDIVRCFIVEGGDDSGMWCHK